MTTYAPREKTAKVLELCNEINPGIQPVWVPVRTMRRAIPNECFENVQSKIKRDAGTIQYGWAIWEWENVLVEAEFHAVWRSPDGRLICVSPNDKNENNILFLPDDTRTFDGINRVDNVRKSLRQEGLVDEFIRVCQERMQEKERLTKGQFGQVSMSEAPELRALSLRHLQLMEEIKRLPPLPKPNADCPCGSGRRYRECCGLSEI